MVVCSCNVLTDTAILKCLQEQEGICRIREVYTNLGCRPQCGRCASTIAGLMQVGEVLARPDISRSSIVDCPVQSELT